MLKKVAKISRIYIVIFHADLSDTIQLALANISDGLCHPLKIRVETVLNSETDLIVLYAVSNLIRFYQNILNNVCALKSSI